jgi:hypothetical protein
MSMLIRPGAAIDHLDRFGSVFSLTRTKQISAQFPASVPAKALCVGLSSTIKTRVTLIVLSPFVLNSSSSSCGSLQVTPTC